MYTEETYRKHTEFFDLVIQRLRLESCGTIIPVLHILPDAIPFLNALKKISTIPFVIAKPKSIDRTVADSLSVEVKHFSRSEINSDTFYQLLPSQKTAYIDIGGYFADAAGGIVDAQHDNFCGIVEDTENGLQRYLQTDVAYPLINVARSPLKENEDYMVGKAIGYSIERILREHNILLNGLKFGIIGYGKIGRSVAKTAKDSQAFVFVNDLNPVRLTHAYSHGYSAHNFDDLISSSDILCIASGRVSLTHSNFQNIKKGCWIFSVTSSDDSIDTDWLKQNYHITRISEHVEKYHLGDHYFYLVNEGNTINFIHGTTVGDFILLVQAELLVSAHMLLNSSCAKGMQELGEGERKIISGLWLEYFS